MLFNKYLLKRIQYTTFYIKPKHHVSQLHNLSVILFTTLKHIRLNKTKAFRKAHKKTLRRPTIPNHEQRNAF